MRFSVRTSFLTAVLVLGTPSVLQARSVTAGSYFAMSERTICSEVRDCVLTFPKIQGAAVINTVSCTVVTSPGQGLGTLIRLKANPNAPALDVQAWAEDAFNNRRYNAFWTGLGYPLPSFSKPSFTLSLDDNGSATLSCTITGNFIL